MYFSVALIVALGLVAFVVAPLLASEGKQQDSIVPIDVTPAADLKRRRLVVYDNIQDLEFEFKSGKIARNDYESLRENYMAEAAQLMLASQEADRPRGAVDTFIEHEVAARRTRRKPPVVEEYACSKCGFENPVPVKFCGNCGAPVASAKRK